MSKFFVNSEQIQGDLIKIINNDVKHIKKVLRLKQGDCIIVGDTLGKSYECEIIDIGQDEVITRVISENSDINNEPPIDVRLYQGIAKGEKMDFIIQKCVELGIKTIVPVITQYTVVEIDKKNATKKLERWQKIAGEASKQCNRNLVPQIMMPQNLEECVSNLSSDDLSIVCYENEKNTGIKSTLNILQNKPKCINIFIGPEGGFSENEIKLLSSKDVQSVTLGPRILRTETAGLAALTIVMYELGDIG